MLKMTQPSEVYYANKRKAAAMGGAAGKPNPAVIARTGEAMGLSHLKNKVVDMQVLCRENVGRYMAPRHYAIKVDTGINHPKIIAPYEYQFKNWYEFLMYFKRMKVLK